MHYTDAIRPEFKLIQLIGGQMIKSNSQQVPKPGRRKISYMTQFMAKHPDLCIKIQVPEQYRAQLFNGAITDRNDITSLLATMHNSGPIKTGFQRRKGGLNTEFNINIFQFGEITECYQNLLFINNGYYFMASHFISKKLIFFLIEAGRGKNPHRLSCSQTEFECAQE